MTHSAMNKKDSLILVVDDDMSMRMLMRAALEQAGFEVAEADNGLAALEVFERLQPAAVLMDVMMPEMDGFEGCRAIRKLPGGEHVPVLMVTGLDDIESIHQAFEAGATDFVTKPINWVMLGYRVRYMLRASEAFHDLHRSQDQLAMAQSLARLGNWVLDLDTRKIEYSQECRRLLGLPLSGADEPMESLYDPIHIEDRDWVRNAIDEAVREKKAYSMNYRIVLSDGVERIVYHQGAVDSDDVRKRTFIRGIVQDVTELKKAEEQIRYLAFFDGLTGLANREMFSDQLEKALAAGKRKRRKMAVLFLDLDRFKRINDTLGHQVGDLLLKNIADRINQCVRDNDSVARMGHDESGNCVSRLGGDEFTVLLTEVSQPEDAAKVARRIIEALPKPLNLEGHEVCVTTSVGISLFPGDGEDAATLLKNADAAMYDAKAKGRNSYQFYSESLNAIASERFRLERDLRKGLERGEFLLHYQPQLDLATGRVIGAEPLIRWKHPERGMVMPGDFIPVAEDSGLIIPITEWVLRTACEQNKAWRDAGMPSIRLAVNLSGYQFVQQNVGEMVADALRISNLDPDGLEVEITEGILMENKEDASSILQDLKDMGVTVAIDDFGTGYSSLGYLKTFPIDILKIDRSFVGDISSGKNDAAIVKAIIALAHSLDLRVIAEGVETVEQMDFLRGLNCDQAQGYYLCRPLPAEDFFDYVKAETCTMAI